MITLDPAASGAPAAQQPAAGVSGDAAAAGSPDQPAADRPAADRPAADRPGTIPGRAGVARILAALLQDDVRRDTGQTVPRGQILQTDRLDEEGLGLDSLARLRAIATVTSFFNLSVTGVEDYLVIDPRLSAWTDIVGHHLALCRDGAEITFTTSGSSGLTPKKARHGLGDMIAEVDAVAATLSGSGPGRNHGIRRIIAAVPPQHIYGFLFTVLLPDRLGCPVADLSEHPPTAALRSAKDGDLVVGTPFTWQQACDGGARAPGACTGLVSTAPAPPSLWADTRAAGVGRLVELYGSSETSGIGWRDAPDAAFALLPHLGRSGDSPARHGVALPLQDRLAWDSPRSFVLGDRIDGSVQVGGTNVAPAAVARTLAQVTGVADAAVRLDGDRLKAFIVPTADAVDTAVLEQRLRRAAARHLAPPARPARYTFGPALPRTAMGKLADWPVADSAPGP